MNIRANLDLVHQPREVGPPGKVGTAAPASAGENPSTGFDGDQAHLSPASSLVGQALALPEVRSDKVTAIQQALAKGAYQIDPSDVAGKLIDYMLGK